MGNNEVTRYQFVCAFDVKKNISAQTAGEVCESLAQKGKLTPQNLLDVSRDKNAPLHDAFEWDDSKAAEAYRINQAGNIIRALRVVSAEEDKQSSLVHKRTDKAYVRAVEERHVYTPLPVAMSDNDMRQRVLKQAMDEAHAFARKYKYLAEYSPKLGYALQALENFERSGA